MKKVNLNYILIIAFIVIGCLMNLISCKSNPVHIKKENRGHFGDTFTNSLGMVFKHITPGTFMMGSPVDEPERFEDEIQHKVTLTKSYYIQTTEATQGQWKAVMGYNPSAFSNCGDDCPVDSVSWNDVQIFINKLNKLGEGIYRLPTEAEWEYAARAGTKTPFYTGDCLTTDDANYRGNSNDGFDMNDTMTHCPPGDFHYRLETLPVASFKPNPWGLYDMHGNVSEFVQDIYDDYSLEVVLDPAGPVSGESRTARDCSWNDSMRSCRSASRHDCGLNKGEMTHGFRLVWNR
jgi:formylglycine-generating enzyme required for sulfatase activity